MNKFLDGLAWTIIGLFVGAIVALAAYALLASGGLRFIVGGFAVAYALIWAMRRVGWLPEE